MATQNYVPDRRDGNSGAEIEFDAHPVITLGKSK